MNHQMLLNLCARLATVVCIAVGSVGCASTRPWTNEPLAAQETVRYDGWAQLFDASRLPDVLVVANFSGGGSRAAAFAHAALSELDAAPFLWRGQETSLAREIDMVTGVSGGSVAAAHLALHGARAHLTRFPADFLDLDFQGQLVSAAISPKNLHRLTSSWYGRGNVLAEELDSTLFKGTTFGQLAQLPGEFESIAGGRRPFIHLVNGGVSDNLGTRRLTDYVAKAGGIGAVMSMLGRGQSPAAAVPRRIVLISVNSESNEGLPIDQSGAVPGTLDALSAMIFGGLGRFSKETSLVFSDAAFG